MKKDSIVHFVCFITDLDLEEFHVKWELYAKRFTTGKEARILQQNGETKGRYKYVSKHVCPNEDFRFTFMKGRTSEHFPEQKVKVVEAGGYSPVQIQCLNNGDAGDVRILAFINHNEPGTDYYRQLTMYHYLNIYEAYYESCAYGYILEFFISPTDASELLLQLKARAGIEYASYKEENGSIPKKAKSLIPLRSSSL
jgi:hypothetical protein